MLELTKTQREVVEWFHEYLPGRHLVIEARLQGLLSTNVTMIKTSIESRYDCGYDACQHDHTEVVHVVVRWENDRFAYAEVGRGGQLSSLTELADHVIAINEGRPRPPRKAAVARRKREREATLARHEEQMKRNEDRRRAAEEAAAAKAARLDH